MFFCGSHDPSLTGQGGKKDEPPHFSGRLNPLCCGYDFPKGLLSSQILKLLTFFFVSYVFKGHRLTAKVILCDEHSSLKKKVHSPFSSCLLFCKMTVFSLRNCTAPEHYSIFFFLQVL